MKYESFQQTIYHKCLMEYILRNSLLMELRISTRIVCLPERLLNVNKTKKKVFLNLSDHKNLRLSTHRRKSKFILLKSTISFHSKCLLTENQTLVHLKFKCDW